MIPNYLCIDIENNNTNRYKRNAGNFMYDKIIAIGIKPYDGESEAIYNPQSGLEALLDIGDYTLLLGHNIKHDLLFLWKDRGIQTFFKKGYKIWDTQLAEYYLTSFQKKYPELRDIAVNKYECKDRIKAIDELLFNFTKKKLAKHKRTFKEQMQRTLVLFPQFLEEDILKFKQVSDLPKELVLEDVQNDVLDTESIFLQQYTECEKRGILQVVELQMESLLFTIEAEYNGFKLNLNTLNQNQIELQTKLDEKTKEFYTHIKPYWDYKEEFILKGSGSKKDLYALFFGQQRKIFTKMHQIDLNGCPIIIKNGKNKGCLKLVNTKTIINITGLGLIAQNNWKTEKGNISIDESMLTEVINTINAVGILSQKEIDISNICALLLEIRGLEKSISTYYESINDLVYDCDSCIHGKFNHVATQTGRLSSNDPNLQNVPRKGDNKIKAHFISRY